MKMFTVILLFGLGMTDAISSWSERGISNAGCSQNYGINGLGFDPAPDGSCKLRSYCEVLDHKDTSLQAIPSTTDKSNGGVPRDPIKLADGSNLEDTNKNCPTGQYLCGCHVDGSGDAITITNYCCKNEQYQEDQSSGCHKLGPVHLSSTNPTEIKCPSLTKKDNNCPTDVIKGISITRDRQIFISVCSFSKKGNKYDASCKDKKTRLYEDYNRKLKDDAARSGQTNGSHSKEHSGERSSSGPAVTTSAYATQPSTTQKPGNGSIEDHTRPHDSTHAPEKSVKSNSTHDNGNQTVEQKQEDEACVCVCNQVCAKNSNKAAYKPNGNNKEASRRSGVAGKKSDTTQKPTTKRANPTTSRKSDQTTTKPTTRKSSHETTTKSVTQQVTTKGSGERSTLKPILTSPIAALQKAQALLPAAIPHRSKRDLGQGHGNANGHGNCGNGHGNGNNGKANCGHGNGKGSGSSELEAKDSPQGWTIDNPNHLKRCPPDQCNCPCVCNNGHSGGGKSKNGSGRKGKKSGGSGGKSHKKGNNGKHIGQLKNQQ